MSTYPTTATLAAFRQSIGHDRFGYNPPVTGPTDATYALRDSLTRSLYPGAWPHELRDGIGLRDDSGHPAHPFSASTLARREAAAMRSRAYEAMPARSRTGLRHPAAGAFGGERIEGLPMFWAENNRIR